LKKVFLVFGRWQGGVKMMLTEMRKKKDCEKGLLALREHGTSWSSGPW
jgi:hypothetical protein